MNYLLGLTLTGIIVGIFAGLIGSGAEILVVPLLTFFGTLGSLKERIGTSLFMILPPIGIFSAIKFYQHGYVNVYAGLYLALLFTIFSFFSTKFVVNLNNTLLRRFFGIFTIICGIYIFLNKE